MELKALRLYSFVNFYLSSIQQGIQTGHAAVRLLRKYDVNYYAHPDDAFIDLCEVVEEWADNHETFIILNGGDNDGIKNLAFTLEGCGFPWTIFKESQEALAGLITCAVVVLPESVYDAKRIQIVDRGDIEAYAYTSLDGKVTEYRDGHRYFDVIKLLRSSKLAQ